MKRPRTSRMRKVNELLREVIAEEVTKLKDPRIGFVTITAVRRPRQPPRRCSRRIIGFSRLLPASAISSTHRSCNSVSTTLSSAGCASAGCCTTSKTMPMDNPAAGHQTVRDAAAAIAAADSFVAVGHIRPDGDALGAALAIALAGRHAGKTAHVTFGEPFVMPGQFRFLEAAPYLPVDEVPVPVDLFIACDTAAESRLGSAAALIEHAGNVLVVDHHISTDGFGDVRYIHPTAAATAEMVYRIIKELGWEITPEVATALYVGLVTDTGRFQYSVTTPAVRRITAELIEAGVEHEVVGN